MNSRMFDDVVVLVVVVDVVVFDIVGIDDIVELFIIYICHITFNI